MRLELTGHGEAAVGLDPGVVGERALRLGPGRGRDHELALGEPDHIRTVRSAGYALDAEGLA